MYRIIQSHRSIELHKVPQGMRIDTHAPFRNIEEDEDRVTSKVECLLYREGFARSASRYRNPSISTNSNRG